jgi:PucR family transcriptional regulator, purine catabolism regulatory protein
LTLTAHSAYRSIVQVSELLELELLQQAGAKVLAGHASLGRDVRWVHTGEIADIARYLTGGEVLLTAATGLASSTPQDHRRYIRELAEAGAAGVIIELGRGFRRIPPAMIEEADRGGLVLVSLEQDVPFVAVTHTVHTQLISSSHETLLRSMDIEQDLSRMIVEGATLPAMLQFLSERVRNPVILEDASHRVVAFGRASGASASILRTWQQHSRARHVSDRPGPADALEAEPPCAWVNIVLRGDRWGRLHVLEVDSPLDDVVRLVLGRMAASIALHLMSERDAYLSDAAEEALVRGLAFEQDFDGQAFVDRATGLGIDLDGDLVMLAVGPDAGARDPTDQGDPVERLVPILREALSSVRWPSIVGAMEGTVAAVVSAEPRGGLAASLDAVAGQMRAREGDLPCIGVSRPCRASALPRAFHEARAAHRFAPAGQTIGVQMYDELALQRLLAPLLNGPELANFVEGELGELIAYDAAHNADLVRTLDAYLQANGSKIATASLLHLRRRSVYYRLERLEQTLGYSIDAPDRRARLYVALRGRELLTDQPALGVSSS